MQERMQECNRNGFILKITDAKESLRKEKRKIEFRTEI